MSAVATLPALHGPELAATTPRWAGVNRTHQIGLADRDDLTWAQADERTRVIAAKLTTLRGATVVVTDLVNDVHDLLEQAWAMRADQTLGYDSWETYCADRFGDLGAIRLPAAERMRVVLALVGTEVDAPRLSGRGAARIMAVDEQTVRADRAAAGITSAPKALAAVKAAAQRSVTLLVLDALAAAGPRGLTITEAVKKLRRSYGSVSGALHALERQGHATRDEGVPMRGTFRPYVAASHLG